MIVIAVLLLLSASDQIPCWKARALIAATGSTSQAEKVAIAHGYSKSQIAEVRRRCGL